MPSNSAPATPENLPEAPLEAPPQDDAKPSKARLVLRGLEHMVGFNVGDVTVDRNGVVVDSDVADKIVASAAKLNVAIGREEVRDNPEEK